MKQRKEKQAGQVVIIPIVIMVVMLAISGALIGGAVAGIKVEKHDVDLEQAFQLAEAGVDKAIDQLNSDQNYSGESDTALGHGVFTVSIASVDSNTRRITSTGYVPDSENPVAQKTVKATAYIDLTNISFQYGIQIGEGGLIMDNNSQVNGNIFSNGNVSGTGIITGDVLVAAGIAPAADQQWVASDADFLFGNIASRKDLAQSFIPSATEKLNKISLYLKKTGTPGNITFRLVTDNAGKPSKTVLAQGSIGAALVTTDYGFIDGAFSSAPNLTSGQKYWIILSAPGISGSNYFSWGIDSSDAYLSNTGKYSSNWNAGSPVWNNAGGDFSFKTWMGGVETVLSGVTVNGTARATRMENCSIGGDAYFDSTNTCAVGGVSHSGATAPSPQAMPISDAQIDLWKEYAASGGVISGGYSVNGNETLGPKKIEGDLTLSNNAILNLTGPIWVDGDIILNNNSAIKIDVSLGNACTVIIADSQSDPANKGKIIPSNNSILTGNGFPNSYLLGISTNTGNNAISVGNNMNSVLFYASKGTINVANNASANQLTGYAINLSNNAFVNYVSGLQNANFSKGPGGSWAYKSGTYSIVK